MKARDIMTPRPAVVGPNDSAQRVAQLMEEHDCGCLPVVSAADRQQVIGVITDRDIALRAVAKGMPADTPAGELMTPDPGCCAADDQLAHVERVMADRQVRRVVVVGGAGDCVGIIAQADIARAAKRTHEPSAKEVVDVLEAISRPS
jgi:CBS domain-containing protein